MLSCALVLLSFAVVASPATATTLQVTGCASDDHGRPVVGAEVTLRPILGYWAFGLQVLDDVFSAEPVATTKTGSDGCWKLASEKPLNGRVEVSGKGFMEMTALVTPLLEDLRLSSLTVTSRDDLIVRVTSGGKAIEGALVRAWADTSTRAMRRQVWRPETAWARTDDKGVAKLPRIASGAARVVVAKPGYVPVGRDEAGANRLDVALEKGSERSILVRDHQRRPVQDAVIQIEGDAMPLAKTDEQGRATLTVGGEKPLVVNVLFEDQAWSGKVPPARPEDDEPFTITLPPVREATGEVRDAETGDPLPNAAVWVALEDMVFTDERGTYRVVVGESERQWVRAAAPGYFSGWQRFSEEGLTSFPTIELRPAVAVVGRITDDAGEPLEQATIEVSPDVSRVMQMRSQIDQRSAWESGGEATSDAKGLFRVSKLVPTVPYRVKVERKGFAPANAEVVAPAVGETARLDVVLQPGWQGHGLVIDEAEQPIAGAEIELLAVPETSSRRMFFGIDQPEPRLAISDGDGRFVLADLPGGRWNLTVRASGFASSTVPGLVIEEGSGDTDLGTVVLGPEVRLGGLVLAPDGQPLSGALVRAEEEQQAMMAWADGNEASRASSGVDGRFELGDLAPGRAYTLHISLTGYAELRLQSISAPSEEPLEITLQPVGRLAGRVLDDRGDPIRNARVRLQADRSFARAMMNRRNFSATNDDGFFQLESIAPGTYQLVVQAETYIGSTLSGIEVDAGTERDDLEVVLQRGASINGVITSRDGGTVADATLWIEPEGAGMVRTAMHVSARSDAEGSYRLDGVELGSRVVVISHPDYVQTNKRIDVEPGDNLLDIVLETGLRVRGVVNDTLGAPVAGAMVSLEPFEAEGVFWRQANATTDAQGVFEVPGVQKGTYHVTANHPDFAQGSTEDPITVETNDVDGVLVTLGGGGSITGTIRGVSFDDLAQLGVTAMKDRDWREGTVDFEGTYRIEGLRAGTWTVWARLARNDSMATGQVEVPENGEAVLDLDMEENDGKATLSGRVLSAGEAVIGASVQLIGVDVQVRKGGSSGANGRYRIEGVDAGRYRVEASGTSGGTAVETIEIAGDLELDLELVETRVTGWVESVDGEPLSGAVIRLEPEDQTRTPIWAGLLNVASDSRGRFVFDTIPPGTYTARVTKAGYGAEQRQLTLTEGDQRDIQFILEPATGLRLRLREAATGLAPTRVQIAVLDATGSMIEGGGFSVADGEVVLSSVPSGSFTVLVTSAGSAVMKMNATVPGPGIDITLQPGGGLRVRVPELQDSSAQATATLTDPTGAVHRAPVEWRQLQGPDFTVWRGLLTVGSLQPGTWSVTITAADGRGWQGQATVLAGETAEITLE
ncbi:MAG: carboxypeptidase-like regulatory domain-containing protein [Acidobacteriota bacterium]